MITFDFDDIQHWWPKLSAHVSGLVPLTSARVAICSGEPKYIEDASEIFFSKVYPEKARFNAIVAAWVKAQTVAAYHGSRLDDADIASIAQKGLNMLSTECRRQCLRKKLSFDPRWREDKLDAVLKQLGASQSWGNREGQVHATISRASLLKGFNHYLTHGSEFDQCVVSLLFGEKAKELLAEYGSPVLVKLAIPGEKALAAANPYRLISESHNLVREIIHVWTYWLADPAFVVAKQEYDCGLIFYNDVSSEWISSIEKVADH